MPDQRPRWLFIADSGAFYNSLTPTAAAEFNLHQLPATGQDYIEAVGGPARVFVTRVDTFTIFDIPVPNVAFMVVGNDLPGGAAGLLGQNIFHIGHVDTSDQRHHPHLPPRELPGHGARVLVSERQTTLFRNRHRTFDSHAPHTKSVAYLTARR